MAECRDAAALRDAPALTAAPSHNTMGAMSYVPRVLLLQISLLGLTACAATPPPVAAVEPETVSTMTSPSDMPSSRPADGAYAGRIDDVHQSVSLQIRADDSARLVVMHALHTPPALVEEYEGQLVERDGSWCLEPAPKSVQSCLDLSGELPALTRVTGERIDLRRVER